MSKNKLFEAITRLSDLFTLPYSIVNPVLELKAVLFFNFQMPFTILFFLQRMLYTVDEDEWEIASKGSDDGHPPSYN